MISKFGLSNRTQITIDNLREQIKTNLGWMCPCSLTAQEHFFKNSSWFCTMYVILKILPLCSLNIEPMTYKDRFSSLKYLEIDTYQFLALMRRIKTLLHQIPGMNSWACYRVYLPQHASWEHRYIMLVRSNAVKHDNKPDQDLYSFFRLPLFGGQGRRAWSIFSRRKDTIVKVPEDPSTLPRCPSWWNSNESSWPSKSGDCMDKNNIKIQDTS